MKKILILLMPMFVCVALVFYFQDREFSFFSMLDIFHSWSFDNGWSLLLDTRDAFSLVSSSFSNISNSTGFIDTLSNIGKMISSFFVGIGTLVQCVAFYLIDLISNISNIFGYLFEF